MPARSPPASPPRAAAFGRSLADFGELSTAEETLLDSCRRGERASVGAGRPTDESSENCVRGDFIRFLALGGDEHNPVHEHGVQLSGAWVTGLLDLNHCDVCRPLALASCVLNGIEAYGAQLINLGLDGSRLVRGFGGDQLACAGSLTLRYGFQAVGIFRLVGARIGGSFDCTGGEFEGGRSLIAEILSGSPAPIRAIIADQVSVSGSVKFGGSFRAAGEVRLLGATIDGNLTCSGGRFDGGQEVALYADAVRVSGQVFLTDGFHATGDVRFVEARIGGGFECVDATFEGPDLALCCARAQIAGAFFFTEIRRLEGSVDLTAMQARTLHDDAASWALAGSRLKVDGMTYGRFSGNAPTDAAMRIAWLDSQEPAHLRAEFRPQPWEQLIAVLRAMGHPEEARNVAIAKQHRLRRAGKIVPGASTLHWLYGVLVGYGYRPVRLLANTASVWLLCAAAYWAGTNPQWFGAETHLLAPPAAEQRTAPEDRARRAPDYANFVPLIYSADVLLPVVDLGYKKEWQPVFADAWGNSLFWGQLLRFLYWFEIAFGWIAGLLLVGVLRNLIKKD